MTWGFGLFPIAVVEDRYEGTYTGHKWWAIASAHPSRYEAVVATLHEGDPEVEDLWKRLLAAPAGEVDGEQFTFGEGLAGGSTPHQAINALRAKMPEWARS